MALRTTGGVIDGVDSGGLGATLGLKPGDRVMAINGQPIGDVLDYGFFIRNRFVHLHILRQGVKTPIFIEVSKEEDDDLGVSFGEATFDGMRRCQNKCLFCFIDQMPPGMRKTLYQKDDDYRYSFWHGSFITLSNLSDAQFGRLLTLRLSPLYVSVQASNPTIRARLLRNRRAGQIMDRLHQLVRARVQVHTQIVCCPGLNNGHILTRTLNDLWLLGDGLASVAVVPVGLTRYRQGLTPLHSFSVSEAAVLLDEIKRWQELAKVKRGETVFFAADEFYLIAGREFPVAEDYDDFCQLENGVGLSRLFIDSWADAAATGVPEGDGKWEGRTFVIVGQSGARVLGPLLAEEMARHKAQGMARDILLVPVDNYFFGPLVTVSGLLTGTDVIATLLGLQEPPLLGDRVVLPSLMFRAEGDMTLDDLTVEAMMEALGGVRIEVVNADGGALWSALWVNTGDRKGRT